MTNIKRPTPSERDEIAGRMYEACDLQAAIEGGYLKSIEEALAWAKEVSTNMQRLHDLPLWQFNDNACVDVEASIKLNESLAITTLPVQPGHLVGYLGHPSQVPERHVIRVTALGITENDRAKGVILASSGKEQDLVGKVTHFFIGDIECALTADAMDAWLVSEIPESAYIRS